MTPTWTQCLRVLVLLSICGFTLVIVSGFARVIALLVIAVVALWLWRHWRPGARR